MTAPTRVAPPGARNRTGVRETSPARERTPVRPVPAPERRQQQRNRSVAAERAYARRAERAQRLRVDRPAPFRRSSASMLSSRASFVVLVMALLGLGVVMTLWLSSQATAGSYQLERARQEVSNLNDEVEQLQQDVARQESAPSLADKARQLGMVPAGVPARLVPGPDGKVTMIGDPSTAQAPPPSVPTDQPDPQNPPDQPDSAPSGQSPAAGAE